MPAEGRDAVIFPPTFAAGEGGGKAGYNIDRLGEPGDPKGPRNVAIIDTVGSQANRMEPLFKKANGADTPYSRLVPQIEIKAGNKVVNLLDAKLAAPNPDFVSYTLSKYALAGLTELAARALAEKGIRVNAIAPSLMLPSGEQGEANFSTVHDFNPLRRGIEVSDVVAALRYLIDSDGMTGQRLVLDGGQRFMGLSRDVQFLETK